MQHRYSTRPPPIRRRKQLYHIQPRLVALCISQMSQKGALQSDDDILHLLASNSVTLLISLAEVSGADIPVREDIFVAANQRPLEVSSRGLVGMATIMPFLLDGPK